MVASARFLKSHRQVIAARPYTDRLTDLVGDLMARGGVEKLDHPLMHEPQGLQRDVLLVLTSKRGLCGGYNSSVLQLAMERHDQLVGAGYRVLLQVSGKRGSRRLQFRGFQIDQVYAAFDFLPEYEAIGRIAEALMREFMIGRIGGLEVVYMQYISSARQQPAVSQLLPMAHVEAPRRLMPTSASPMEYELIPSADEILRNLLPATVRLRLWQCFLDASISERVMRMTAMRAATENADAMIHDLTVRYNRMRQAQITTELAEIVGGRTGID